MVLWLCPALRCVPYCTVSEMTANLQVFALHPLYLSLSDLAPTNLPDDIAKSIEKARQELDGPAVHYERTVDLKLTLARRIFDAAGHAELKVSCL